MPSRIEEMVALSRLPIVVAQAEANAREARARFLPPRNRTQYDPDLQRRARAAVRRALRDGRLTQAAHCEAPECTKTTIEAHHHKGYAPDVWLDVVWLCPRHHRVADHARGDGDVPN